MPLSRASASSTSPIAPAPRASASALRPGGRFATDHVLRRPSATLLLRAGRDRRPSRRLPAPASGWPGPFSLGSQRAWRRPSSRPQLRRHRRLGTHCAGPAWSRRWSRHFEREPFGARRPDAQRASTEPTPGGGDEVEEALGRFEARRLRWALRAASRRGTRGTIRSNPGSGPISALPRCQNGDRRTPNCVSRGSPPRSRSEDMGDPRALRRETSRSSRPRTLAAREDDDDTLRGGGGGSPSVRLNSRDFRAPSCGQDPWLQVLSGSR